MGIVYTPLNTKPKLLEQVRITLRTLHYSKKTEVSYVSWIKQFIIFNNKIHPEKLDVKDVSNFLSYLAINRNVSASTQNQALCAIVFLYKKVLEKDFGYLDEVVKAHRSVRIPVVFTRQEVKEVFRYLDGTSKLVCSLLYGSGLRLGEALELRIKDINFEYRQITVSEAKGDKDRITTLPESIIPELKQHLNRTYKQHKEDLAKGKGKTILPNALAKKYPNADKDYFWQYVFPADKRIKDIDTNKIIRYHLHESTIQKAIKYATQKTSINKKVGAHTFRHLTREINNYRFAV